VETKIKIITFRNTKEARLAELERIKNKFTIKKGYVFKEYVEDGKNSYALFDVPTSQLVKDKGMYFAKWGIALFIIAAIFLSNDSKEEVTESNSSTELPKEYYQRELAKQAGADYDKIQSTLQKNLEAFGNKKLTKQTFKKEWAFTVDAVELQCNDLGEGINAPVVVANGHKYPLTGFAKKYADAPLEEIWRENPNIPGTRVDISPVRELCGI